MIPLQRKIRVLIVDDSAIVRKNLTETLAAEPDIEVVATAPDAYIARDKLLALRPDVITLDIEMPRMDGLTFLRQLMFLNPIPTVIVSSQGQFSCAAALEALRCGAVDVVAKPATSHALRDLRLTLAQKVRGAASARPRPATDLPPSATAPGPRKDAVIPSDRASAQVAIIPSECVARVAEPPHLNARRSSRLAIDNPAPQLSPSLIAIGASTGGTVAIQEILTRLPADMPPILITQHIPAGFSRAFAERLNRICALEVREAAAGDLLRPGLALLAPGDHHLIVRDGLQGLYAELDRGPEVSYLRPSVDVMFFSIAEAAEIASSAIAVLLTGMGADGARGMAALKQAGAVTIAQDEATSVVYGMPREAVRLGAVDTSAPLSSIPALLTRLARAPRQIAPTAPEPALQEPIP